MGDTGGSYSGGGGASGPSWDAEPVCYTLLATDDEVHSGTKRHDDSFPPPGFMVFDADGAVINTSQGGYEEVPCDFETCCPVQIGEGCWDDGTDEGERIAFRLADGTIERTDTLTGDPVDDADVVTCAVASRVDATTLQPIAAGQQFNIPASTLISWSVRVLTGTADLEVNGTATTLPTGSIVESAAEDGATLSDSVMVTAAAASTALLVYVTRT